MCVCVCVRAGRDQEHEYSSSLADARSLYSEQLSAVILPHEAIPPNPLRDLGGAGSSSRVKKFVQTCRRASDFHFDDVHAQVAAGLAAAPATGPVPGPEKEKGPKPDMVITRHSTLRQCQVVFHMFNVDPGTIHSGIQEILYSADRHGIARLTLPLLFSEAEILSLRAKCGTVGPAALERSITDIMRCVKTALIEIASGSRIDQAQCLKEISFMLPFPVSSWLVSYFAVMLLMLISRQTGFQCDLCACHRVLKFNFLCTFRSCLKFGLLLSAL